LIFIKKEAFYHTFIYPPNNISSFREIPGVARAEADQNQTILRRQEMDISCHNQSMIYDTSMDLDVTNVFTDSEIPLDSGLSHYEEWQESNVEAVSMDITRLVESGMKHTLCDEEA
jgi:hypothetical protein